MPFIYVAHEREFRRHDEPVFKVGFTDATVEQRMKGYPKGTVALMSCSVADGRAAETSLLRLLEAMPGVVTRRDIGREYFEASLGDLARAFGSVAACCVAEVPLDDSGGDDAESIASTVVLVPDDDNAMEAAEGVDALEVDKVCPMDAFAAVTAFVAEHDRHLHRGTFALAALHDRFCAWLKDRAASKAARKLSMGGLGDRLRSIYGATLTTMDCDRQIVAAVKMPVLRSDMPGEDNDDDSAVREEVEAVRLEKKREMVTAWLEEVRRSAEEKLEMVTDWLDAHVVRSENTTDDYIILKELYTVYAGGEEGAALPLGIFKKAAGDWFKSAGYTVTAQATKLKGHEAGSRKSVRGFVRGCKLV